MHLYKSIPGRKGRFNPVFRKVWGRPYKELRFIQVVTGAPGIRILKSTTLRVETNDKVDDFVFVNSLDKSDGKLEVTTKYIPALLPRDAQLPRARNVALNSRCMKENTPILE